MLFVLTFIVNATRARDRQPPEGFVLMTTLDRARDRRCDCGSSGNGWRKAKDRIATGAMYAAFGDRPDAAGLAALHRHQQGLAGDHVVGLVGQRPAQQDLQGPRRRRLARDRRHRRRGRDLRGHLGADRA